MMDAPECLKGWNRKYSTPAFLHKDFMINFLFLIFIENTFYYFYIDKRHVDTAFYFSRPETFDLIYYLSRKTETGADFVIVLKTGECFWAI